MSFLYPAFLWATAVLSIPVIIHLFNFRRTTRVYFSNTRLLKTVKEVTTSKRKLKHLLILCSRLLFLLFLVFAFAQPVIPAREQVLSQRKLTLYVDNSFSMSAQLEDNRKALDAGIVFVQELVGLFPPDTRYRLLTNDFSPFSNSLKSKEEILDLLTQVRLSPVSRSAAEIINRLEVNQENAGDEVFWISDFQRSTFGDAPLTMDSGRRWHLVPITPATNGNVFIDTVFLDNPFAIGQEKNAVTVRLRNDGATPRDQLNVKLTINGIQAAATAVSLPAGGETEMSFDLTTNLSGLNQAQLSFNDQPVNFDNEFYFALNYTERINVLEITRTAGPTPVARVFGNQDVFTYKGYSVANFDYSALNQAELVIVNGLDRIDASLVAALRNYLNNFGTLLVIPGPRPDAGNYQTLLAQPVNINAGGAAQELDKPDFDNPFFENVFEERSPLVSMPVATPLVEWGNDRSAILQFKNGRPFLSRLQPGTKLFLMAAPLEDAFTDFHKNALFVPVMYRLAATAKTSVTKPYHTLDDNFLSVKVDTILGEEPLRIVGEQEIIPSQRKVNDRVLMEVPRHTVGRGFYYVTFQRDTLDLLAFNLNKDESLMGRLSMREVRDKLGEQGNVTEFQAGSPAAFSNEIKARYLGTPLWKYALAIALACLLMEVLLIRFMK